MDRIWLDRSVALTLAVLATTILLAINYFESAIPGAGYDARFDFHNCHPPPGWFCVAL